MSGTDLRVGQKTSEERREGIFLNDIFLKPEVQAIVIFILYWWLANSPASPHRQLARITVSYNQKMCRSGLPSQIGSCHADMRQAEQTGYQIANEGLGSRLLSALCYLLFYVP